MPVSDPEKIIHRRGWKEKKSTHVEIPEFSQEDYPSSSSQEIPVENPDFTEENPNSAGEETNGFDLVNHCGGQ